MFPNLSYVKAIVSFSYKIIDTYININVEFGDEKGQIPIDKIMRKAEGSNLTKR